MNAVLYGPEAIYASSSQGLTLKPEFSRYRFQRFPFIMLASQTIHQEKYFEEQGF